jgi:hypothetical protein
MPKSEFDSPLAVRGGRVAVSGVVDEPAHVHWVIEQGDLVAHGVTVATGSTFSDQEASAQPWKDGRAHVSGVRIARRRKPAGLDTFDWDQEVELKVG